VLAPSVGVEWSARLFRIPETTLSTTGPDTGYPAVFRNFTQFFQAIL